MVKIDGLGQKIGVASFIGAVGLLTVMARNIISDIKKKNEPVIPGERMAEKPSNALFYAEKEGGEYFFITDDDVRSKGLFRT